MKRQPKSFRCHWSPKQKKRLRELFHAGKSDAEIVRIFEHEKLRPGVTTISVGYTRVQCGLRRRGSTNGKATRPASARPSEASLDALINGGVLASPKVEATITIQSPNMSSTFNVSRAKAVEILGLLL